MHRYPFPPLSPQIFHFSLQLTSQKILGRKHSLGGICPPCLVPPQVTPMFYRTRMNLERNVKTLANVRKLIRADLSLGMLAVT
jgi:hypothetical protein